MKKSNWFIISTLLLICPVFLQAQGLETDQDVSQDRLERAGNDANLERDARELRGLEMSMARISEAYEIGDMESVEAMKPDVLEAMQREIQQAEATGVTTKSFARQQDIYSTLSTTGFSASSDGTTDLQLVNEFIQIMEEEVTARGAKKGTAPRDRN